MVTAQVCSTRFASLWTRWCNCGEALSASAQRNAAETNAATRARSQLFERANVPITLRACNLCVSCARNFCGVSLGSALPALSEFERTPRVLAIRTIQFGLWLSLVERPGSGRANTQSEHSFSHRREPLGIVGNG